MGWTGVTLNLGTSIIASIAIGIAVEDAIRYLARLSAEIQATHDQERAIFQTVSTVGKPIIYASTALGLGFLMFLFSNFVPILPSLIAASVLTAEAIKSKSIRYIGRNSSPRSLLTLSHLKLVAQQFASVCKLSAS